MNISGFEITMPNLLKFMRSPQRRECTVGLDFNHARVIAVELQKASGGRPVLTKLISEPLKAVESNPEAGAEPLSWAPAFLSTASLESLTAKSRLSTPKVNIAISGPVVLTRFIPFPKMTLKELKATMQFEIEKYIPFESNDVISDFHILGGDGQDKKNMKVILVAAKKTEISSLINLFRKTRIQIRVIDIHAFACFNAFNHAHQNSSKGPSVLLDISSETCSLMVITDTEPAFIREISLGSLDILETFKKKCGLADLPQKDADIQNAVSSHAGLFKEAAEPLVSQIRLSLNYFSHNNPKIDNPKVIYLSGELCTLKEFQSDLLKVLEIQPELWDCLKNIDLANDISKDEIANLRHLLPISVGLALRTE